MINFSATQSLESESIYGPSQMKEDDDENFTLLNLQSISTWKAFNNLKYNMINRINTIIKQSRTFDYEKSMKNISWYHRLAYKLGCIKYNKKI